VRAEGERKLVWLVDSLEPVAAGGRCSVNETARRLATRSRPRSLARIAWSSEFA